MDDIENLLKSESIETRNQIERQRREGWAIVSSSSACREGILDGMLSASHGTNITVSERKRCRLSLLYCLPEG